MILLIIIQAVFTIIGSLALARKIRSLRKRLEVVGGIAFLLPIAFYAISLSGSGLDSTKIAGFFEFYIYSVLANAISGAVTQVIEDAVSNLR